VLREPPGGAHHSYDEAAMIVGDAVARHLRELSALPQEGLLDGRYAKYRALGRFEEPRG